MRVPHVAITLESPKIVDASEVARVAAAIQRQVTRDFAPAWGVHATVDVFPRLESVPADYWPVVLTRRHLGDDEGFHLTHDGQPFSVVEAIAGWSQVVRLATPRIDRRNRLRSRPCPGTRERSPR